MPSDDRGYFKDELDYNHTDDCPWANAWPPVAVGRAGCNCWRKPLEPLKPGLPSAGEVVLTIIGVAVGMLVVIGLMALADRFL